MAAVIAGVAGGALAQMPIQLCVGGGIKIVRTLAAYHQELAVGGQFLLLPLRTGRLAQGVICLVNPCALQGRRNDVEYANGVGWGVEQQQ